MKESQKERLRMLNSLKRTLCGLIAIASVPASASVDLQGDFIQGGLIIGQSSKRIESVKIDTVKVPIHTNKQLFTFGFGRDAATEAVLTVVYESGEKERRSLSVKQRTYEIDRVNGVASKYVSPPQEVLERIKRDGKVVKEARAKMSYRSDFLTPVIKPAEGRISGVYGSQRIFNGVPKRPHFGLDIAAPTGTKVIAPWDGKVVLAEPDLYYSGGTLIIDHGLGITSTYIHLSKLDVKQGDVIKQGEKIAEIGATGRVTGAHLDWRLNWFSRRLDPQLLLN
jgi:murein DD-endopeptidase MepM/ murein hydrolase activator NlpD